MIDDCPKGSNCPFWKILEVTRRLTASIELAPLLTEVMAVACSVLNADRASVFLYDSKKGELYSKVATGEKEIRFAADHRSIVGHTMESRIIVNVPDCSADPRHNPEVDRRTGYQTRSLLSVPLIGNEDEPVGVLQLLNKRAGPFGLRDEQAAGVLAAQCAVVLQRAILLEDQLTKQKLERDLAVARDIQMRALPGELPQVEGFDLAGWTTPAEQTGGDIYDVAKIGKDQIALMLGDATGHGIGPALSVTQVRAMFRMALRLGADLQVLVEQLNAQLVADLPIGRFVTTFLGLLDTDRNYVTYHSAGQAPLLHFVSRTGSCNWLNATTVPLGIEESLILDRPTILKLDPGDIFALISDGVYEYQDKSMEQFGRQRVEKVLQDAADRSCDNLLGTLREEVEQFSSGAPQNDDMTILLVKREP